MNLKDIGMGDSIWSRRPIQPVAIKPRDTPRIFLFGRELRASIDLVWGGGLNKKEYTHLDDFVEEI